MGLELTDINGLTPISEEEKEELLWHLKRYPKTIKNVLHILI